MPKSLISPKRKHAITLHFFNFSNDNLLPHYLRLYVESFKEVKLEHVTEDYTHYWVYRAEEAQHAIAHYTAILNMELARMEKEVQV